MITDRNTPETDLLFQHFATLATGPGGVPRLRELILQLAIYGKIYTYDTDDDPVKLFEIGNKTFPPLKIFNLINLPKGWIWSKLGNIAEVGQGGTPRTSNPEFWNGSIPWLRSGNIKFNRINQANETISELGLKNSAAKLCPIGTVLLAMTGQGVTRGRAAILDIEASANQSCAHIILNKKLMIPEFLFYFFKTEYWNIRTLDKGTGQPGINTKIIKAFDIPLPPLAEQHRIVEKVDRLMALCDQLEKQQQQERSTCLQLGTASFAGLQNAESPEDFERQWAQICDTFDLMLDCPENVAVLRQTILQLAVQGKLGTQDEGDEAASVLLERIRGEKERQIKDGTLRKEKPMKYLSGNIRPFNIPNKWLWAYFGEMTFNRDSERIPIEKAERESRHGDYDYYGASGIIDTIDDYLFDQPLLLIGEDGANLINRSTPIAFIAFGKYWVNNHAHVIDGISLEFLRYLEIYINSIDLKPYLTGMAQPKLNQAKLNSISVPLPPLAEQHRIVEKVDRLMALCDQLEAQLKNRAGVQERFAKAVVGGIAT